MKIFTKTNQNDKDKVIRRYKIFGITILRRDTTSNRKRWYIGHVKIASFKHVEKRRVNSINTTTATNAVINPVNINLEIFNKQREEFSADDYAKKVSELKHKPTFSIIMPIYNADPRWLNVAIESLKKQYYPNWQLIAIDDGSVDRRACAILKHLSAKDKRIIFHESGKNGGISAASNIGLKLSTNKYFLLMDQDDEIAPDALYWFADALEKHPDADVIYSDECKIDTQGNLSDFYFKPDWSPALLLNHMYTGHMSLYKLDTVKKAGGFRIEYDFSQDYDLILRVSDKTNKIYHIERVLYFWRTLPSSGAAGGKDWARQTNIRALTDWYKRQGLKFVFKGEAYSNYGRVIRKNNPLVSIIIPSDSLDNLTKCIHEILKRTSYANIEIVPVTNSKTARELSEVFGALDILNICHYNNIFNFSDKCNEGAKQATGEYVVFYNDDVFPENPDWIERLLDVIVLKNVGGVSPLLKYENGTIQYAGMMTNVPGFIGTSFHCYNAADINYGAFHHGLIKNVSVLSGACFLMKRDLFFKIGGFDAENTPNGHSDVDISFKILDAGLQNVCTPAAVMTHIGNHTWHAKNTKDKSDIFLLKRWGKYMSHEPYFTQSMKHSLYKDFVFDSIVYTPDNIFIPKGKDSKDVLLITHELTRTGAPVVLLEMVKVLKKNNMFPVVLSPVDGPLRQEFLDAGITVIIDPSFTYKHWLFERFARNFDFVVANTLATGYAVEMLNDSLPQVIWWIHEGSCALECLKHLIPNKIGKNVSVYCVSEYSKNIIKPFINKEISIFPFGINDFSVKKKNKKTDKINFVTVGTIEGRKGQDILLNAIKKLPKEYLIKSHFSVVGKFNDFSIINALQDFSDKEHNVTILDQMPRQDVLDLYQNIDCIITPSRDEPMSITTIEMFIQKKLCIVSDACGIASFIDNDKSGLVFKSENIDDLVEKIKYVIDNFEKLDSMRTAGRKIYENNFTTQIFEKNFLSILKKLFN